MSESAGRAPTGSGELSPVVTDVPEAGRYEARVGGKLAALAEYRLRPGRIVFIHTETDQAFRGHGMADVLVRTALDDARRRGLTVTASCPYVAGWIRRHPDYADLVAEAPGAEG